MSEEERYPFQNFKVSPLSTESPTEYSQRFSESINSHIRSQIYKNMCRNALYTLHFILEEEAQGRDSYTILEDLKRFMLQLAQQDKEVGKQAEEIFEKSRSRNKREAQKFEDLLNTKATS